MQVENLLDPAHVPFTHEGTIGNRKQVAPLRMTMTTLSSLPTADDGQKLPPQSTVETT